MLRIAIIIGCTRPARIAAAVGAWAYEIARKRHDAEFELLDLATVDLPLLDEPKPAMSGQYTHDHAHVVCRRCLIRRLCLRHPRVQSRHLRRAQERDRFSLPGVDQHPRRFNRRTGDKL